MNFSRKEKLFLLLILLLTFLLRWYRLDRLPYGFEGDETSWSISALLQLHNILPSQAGIWSAFDATLQFFPTSIKINQLAFYLFGKQLLSTRKMLIPVNLLSFGFFYLILRQFMSKKSALITLTIYSASTYKLITSRVGLQHVYSELTAFPAILLSLKMSNNNFRNLARAFLAGIFSSISLLTYNLSYMIPVISLIIIIFGLSTNKVRLRNILLTVFFFFLPVLIFSNVWFPGLKNELAVRNYMFNNQTPTSLIFNIQALPFRVIYHLSQINHVLLSPLDYSTSDMLVSYPSTLIPKSVVILFLFGLTISMVELNKFFPLVIWFILHFTSYHVVLGLNLPRTWFLTIGLLYIFAGLSIEIVIKKITNSNSNRKMRYFLFVLISCLTSLFYYQNLSIFFVNAVKATSYKVSIREKADLLQKYKKNIGNNIFFVSKEDFEANAVRPFMIFYYLSEISGDINLSLLSRQRIGSLTLEEFKANQYPRAKASHRIIIAEKQISEDVKENITANKSCSIKNEKDHVHYAEMVLDDCIR